MKGKTGKEGVRTPGVQIRQWGGAPATGGPPTDELPCPLEEGVTTATPSLADGEVSGAVPGTGTTRALRRERRLRGPGHTGEAREKQLGDSSREGEDKGWPNQEDHKLQRRRRAARVPETVGESQRGTRWWRRGGRKRRGWVSRSEAMVDSG